MQQCLRRRAARPRPATEGPGAARRLGARWIGGVHWIALRLVTLRAWPSRTLTSRPRRSSNGHDRSTHSPVRTPARRMRQRMGMGFVIGVVVNTAAIGAQFTAELRPWEDQAITVESGMLWNVGNSTPLSYRLVPTQLSWRSREIISRQYTAT